MMAQAGTFTIQWQVLPQFCFGVEGEPAENSPVVLANMNAPFTTWNMDPNTGFIALSDSPTLVLSCPGAEPAQGARLCLLPVMDTTLNQQWDWFSNPPYILLQAAPTMCIDNGSGGTSPGNPLILFDLILTDANQGWQMLQSSS